MTPSQHKRQLYSSPKQMKRAKTPQILKNSEPIDGNRSVVETWLACGKCASTMGVLHIAINCFETALKYEPSNTKAVIGVSDALRQKDIESNQTVGITRSIDILNSFINQNPSVRSEVKLWKKLAESYFLINEPEQAHKVLKSALEMTAADPSLWILEGQCLIRLGMTAEAVDAIVRSLNLLPQSLVREEDIDISRSAHAELAAIAAAEGNTEAATNELNAALSLPPPPKSRTDEYAALWCAYATAREHAGDIGGAISACESAEAAIGDYSRILITHAYLLLLQGTPFFKPVFAVQLLEKAIEIEKSNNPNIEESSEGDFLPWYLLGYAYTLIDSPRLAYDAYQLSLRKSPLFPLPWLAVGALYLTLGQLGDSLSAYSHAVRLQSDNTVISAPASAAAWEGLSCVYERCDDQAKDATDACRRAAECYRISKNEEAAVRCKERAQVLERVGNHEIPMVEFRSPPEFPYILLRDLVPLSAAERINVLAQQSTNQQSNQPPLPAQPTQPPQQVQSQPIQQGHPVPTGQPTELSPVMAQTQQVYSQMSPNMINPHIQQPPLPQTQQQGALPPPIPQTQDQLSSQQQLQQTQPMPPQKIPSQGPGSHMGTTQNSPQTAHIDPRRAPGMGYQGELPPQIQVQRNILQQPVVQGQPGQPGAPGYSGYPPSQNGYAAYNNGYIPVQLVQPQPVQQMQPQSVPQQFDWR